MRIVAFGGSISSDSINKEFARYAMEQFKDLENVYTKLLDLNDYKMAIFSTDEQEVIGVPAEAKKFLEEISEADLLIVSLAENNGAYSVGFKNIMDWTSIIKKTCFAGPKMFLLATSPGGIGGQNVLDIAKVRFPIMGADIVGIFSLPEYYKNYKKGEGITNAEIMKEFKAEVLKVKGSLEV